MLATTAACSVVLCKDIAWLWGRCSLLSTAPEATALRAHPIPALVDSMLKKVQTVSLPLKDVINIYTLTSSAEEDERERIH
jgi:hypothetical protein